MKPFLLSLGVGLLVGVIYSLLGVRSPAPPTVALVGLLGILIGEQVVPYTKRIVDSAVVNSAVHAPAAQEAHEAPRPNPKAPAQLPRADAGTAANAHSEASPRP